jgi:hypothetical protein
VFGISWKIQKKYISRKRAFSRIDFWAFGIQQVLQSGWSVHRCVWRSGRQKRGEEWSTRAVKKKKEEEKDLALFCFALLALSEKKFRRVCEGSANLPRRARKFHQKKPIFFFFLCGTRKKMRLLHPDNTKKNNSKKKIKRSTQRKELAKLGRSGEAEVFPQ